jgi:hypothetical protein
MRLKPHILEACYSFLRCTPPFSGWHMPEADDVQFHVTRFGHMADYGCEPGEHVIRISERRVELTNTLVQTMAHEMVHLYLTESGQPGATEHGIAFTKAWKTVCRNHGWDRKET